MIWWLSKSNHELAIHHLVRTWLRMGPWSRLLVILSITVFSWALSALAGTVLLSVLSQSQWIEDVVGLLGAVVQLAWPLWLADLIIEKIVTRQDLRKLMGRPSIALATRGEYIGGHPKLPHGRFVYLMLSGVLENPNLTIVLPQPEGVPSKAFPMPVLDLQKTTEKKEKDDSESLASATLAFLTYRSKFLGERAMLNVEYIAQAGRKQRVEFTNFLTGNGEIQTWRNYIVCIQAEADTGQKPYGPWKSLPPREEMEKGA